MYFTHKESRAEKQISKNSLNGILYQQSLLKCGCYSRLSLRLYDTISSGKFDWRLPADLFSSRRNRVCLDDLAFNRDHWRSQVACFLGYRGRTPRRFQNLAGEATKRLRRVFAIQADKAADMSEGATEKTTSGRHRTALEMIGNALESANVA
jgi:hypothetical protein